MGTFSLVLSYFGGGGSFGFTLGGYVGSCVGRMGMRGIGEKRDRDEKDCFLFVIIFI